MQVKDSCWMWKSMAYFGVPALASDFFSSGAGWSGAVRACLYDLWLLQQTRSTWSEEVVQVLGACFHKLAQLQKWPVLSNTDSSARLWELISEEHFLPMVTGCAERCSSILHPDRFFLFFLRKLKLNTAITLRVTFVLYLLLFSLSFLTFPPSVAANFFDFLFCVIGREKRGDKTASLTTSVARLF